MRFTYTYRSSDGLRHGLRPRRRPERFKVSVLVESSAGIRRIVLYPSGKILDRHDVMFLGTREKCRGESFKIKPLIGRFLQQSMMKVESINVEYCLFLFHFCTPQRQGPDFRPALHRIAVAQRVVSNPSRGSSGNVPNQWMVRKRGFGRK